MAKCRLCLLALLLTTLPSVAHAQGGWWDAIEEWSGPGPFQNGGVIDVRLGCFTSTEYQKRLNDQALRDKKDNPAPWMWLGEKVGDERPCFTRNPSFTAGYIDLRYVRGTTPDQSLFADRPTELRGVVTEQTFQAFAMYQVTKAVAVGAGAGVTWVTGPTIDQSVHPFILTPISVSVTPLRWLPIEDKGWKSKLSRLITLNFDEFVVMGTFDAHSFNSTSTSSFRTSTELHRSYSVVVDVLALID